MKIFVLGYKGMLGRYVYTYLKLMGHDVRGLSRDELDITEIGERQLTYLLPYKGVQDDDVIINCIGAIKPQVDKLGTLNAIKVNSLFPHYLANACQENGAKMIHITTDCCYSGKDGKYDETAPHDALDVYGKSKSLGEPSNCTVVRTSIIGEEVGTQRSLLEWIKSMEGKTANGFINHYWNGLMCLEVAKVFEKIITSNRFWDGVMHIYSPNIFTKADLVSAFSDIYGLNITVIPMEAREKCDRTLSTIYKHITFEIPDIESQIEEQFYYKSTLLLDF